MSHMEVDDTAQPAIDESLYSRQLYVLGKEAMQKMAASHVLIAGLGGVGIEIAKNIALAGVKSLTVWDPATVTKEDLASQFYLREEDIGSQTRAAASGPRLAELNQYTPVIVADGSLEELLPKYQIVILTEIPSGAGLEDVVKLSQACREAGTKFMWVSTQGLVGTIFNDFGENFSVIDTDGEEPLEGSVATIEKDGEVFAPESGRHGLETGALIELQDVTPASLNGEYRVKVSGPLSFNIGDLPAAYEKGGRWKQIKEPSIVNFEPLYAQLAKPEFFVTDFAKFDRPPQLHIASLAILAFRNKHSGALPRPYNDEDANEVAHLAINVSKQYPEVLGSDGEVDAKLVKLVAKQARGDIAPVNAVLGGTAAQEALKAVSGKFSPIKQWMYFDALETLPENVSEADAQPLNSRYDLYYATLGKPFMDQLANLKVFLVGAGAIGCEVLKNWALLGVGSGPNGHITVTDNDTIEKSNLNRQFLFRPKDVGKPKSETAAAAVAAMNPSLSAEKFTTLTEKVGTESQNIFNEDFWRSLDLVTNALDNVEARTYVDRRCVRFQKPLIESGTLGSKGNVQVVVPNLTESYSSSHDPPEKAIPLCTLRSFPSKIDHTIAWAKHLFEEKFEEAPSQVNAYLSQPNFVESTLKQSSNQKATLESIYSSLVESRPLKFEQCIDWAVDEFQKLFYNDVMQLLYNFPADAKTNTGAPFWAPPKRVPEPQKLDLSRPDHLEFIIAAANLHAFNYGLKGERDPKVFFKALENYSPPEFTPKSDVHIKADDNEPDVVTADQEHDVLVKIAEKLPAPSTLAGFRLQPVEFEKDDDTNFHIAFINAASNVRAVTYGIEPVESSRTKYIAGRIIPAIATTTALVTGLSTLEALKVVQNKTLEEYKNGFVNLALPFFGFSEPIASGKIKYNKDREFDRIWSRFEFNDDLTLQGLIDYFAKEYELEISMLSCGNLLLYASFFPPKKLNERLPLSITKLVELVSQKPLPEGESSLTLEACAEDTEGEDVDDLPFIVVNYAS